jgi:L-fucose isomerase-like protein
MKRLKVGLAGLMQVNFTGDKEGVFRRAVTEMERLAGEMGFEFEPYPKLMITGSEAAEGAAWLDTRGCDFVLVLAASFAAGEAILPFARMKARIGIWAVPEPASTGEVGLNSFCAVNMQAGIITAYLKEYAIPYKWFFGWTDGERFLPRLRATVAALTAIKNLNGARVALVGGIAPGFNDLYYDERLAEKRLGVTIERNVEFEDAERLALDYGEAEIKESLAFFTRGYREISEGSRLFVELQARFFRAYAEIAGENGYDALAVSCWPKIQSRHGLVGCSILGKLNERGIPAACEGDAPGAVSQLFLKYVSGGGTTTLLDMAGFDEADDTLNLWHCGPSALCLADGCGARMRELTHHTKDGAYIHLPSYNDLVFKPGAATVMRFTGEWDSMFLLGGSFIDYQKDCFAGSSGWFGNLKFNGKPTGALDVTNTILSRGFQHHYPLVYGDHVSACMEAAAWLGLKEMKAAPYAEYLQR